MFYNRDIPVDNLLFINRVKSTGQLKLLTLTGYQVLTE